MFSSIRNTVRDKDMMHTIFCLAWPTVMEQALQTIVQYADTAQVGAIGANASAAVGLTTTMMWLINAPMFALAMGVLSCISRALGAKDTKRAQKAAAQSVLITVALGVVLTEVDPQGVEHQRGMKAITIPAHSYPTCRDVLVRCIKFVLPEDLDVSTSNPKAICNARNLKVRLIAHNIDTDFRCCNSVITV